MFIALKYTEKRGFSDIHRLDPSKRKGQNALGIPSILCRLGALELQLEPVRDQGNKLPVGGLAPAGADGVAEVAAENVHVRPGPGDLDQVADAPLHPGGGGVELGGDLGIEAEGDVVDAAAPPPAW